MSDEYADTFGELLKKITAKEKNIRTCIRYITEHLDHSSLLFGKLLKMMNSGSINTRAKLVNLLEYGLGFVGQSRAPNSWNKLVIKEIYRISDLAVPQHLYPAALANIPTMNKLLSFMVEEQIITSDEQNKILQKIDAKMEYARKYPDRGGYRYLTKEEAERRTEDDRTRSKAYRDRESATATGSKQEFDRIWAAVDAVNNQDRETIAQWNRILEIS